MDVKLAVGSHVYFIKMRDQILGKPEGYASLFDAVSYLRDLGLNKDSDTRVKVVKVEVVESLADWRNWV